MGAMGWFKSVRTATGAVVASGTPRATGRGTAPMLFLAESTCDMVSEGRLQSGARKGHWSGHVQQGRCLVLGIGWRGIVTVRRVKISVAGRWHRTGEAGDWGRNGGTYAWGHWRERRLKVGRGHFVGCG
jgi:hypothetical protein